MESAEGVAVVADLSAALHNCAPVLRCGVEQAFDVESMEMVSLCGNLAEGPVRQLVLVFEGGNVQAFETDFLVNQSAAIVNCLIHNIG